MRPRCLLSCVDRLPTISESQEELDLTEADLDDYLESIRELSQPPQPCYPLHGPLRGHRRSSSLLIPCHGTNTARSPVRVSDVSLRVTHRSPRYQQNVLEALDAQAVFAGL